VWSNLKVGFYRGKCLNGTKDCAITVCEDINLSVESSAASEELKPKQKETKEITGRIVAVDITKFFLCMNCKGRLVVTDESKFVECSACKLRMLKENLDSTVSGSIIIVNESGENLGRFHCQENMLNGIQRITTSLSQMFPSNHAT
jgi:DNA-directed RNA polymerase subunit RPC12/RpoP